MYDGRMIIKLGVSVVVILLAVSLYRAYVVFKPCDHKLDPLDESNRFKLTSEQTQRFQDALRIPTVSTAFGVENRTAKFELLKFIRKGILSVRAISYVEVI